MIELSVAEVGRLLHVRSVSGKGESNQLRLSELLQQQRLQRVTGDAAASATEGKSPVAFQQQSHSSFDSFDEYEDEHQEQAAIVRIS